MSEIFRPMLATDADLNKLRYPLLASAKLDGVRATIRNGVVYSRSNKPIPNREVQAKFKHLEHFDGELIHGNPCSKTCYRDTVSTVMSEDKPADEVLYFAFDHIEVPNATYYSRAKALRKDKGVIVLKQKLIKTFVELLAYEEEVLDAGYEGLILRSPDAPYKMGRSTVNEGYLLKLKRFVDDEAIVIGFEERMKNNNEKVTNELGRGQRSSHKENKTGRGDLGALVLRLESGVEFSCGTGFSDPERAEIWASKDKFLGAYAKFKYFPIGQKDAPRHPVFLGWRDGRDR